MNFDPARTPFSRRNAYVSVSVDPDKNELVIHNVRKVFGADRAFALSLLRNNAAVVDWRVEATPWELTVRTAEGMCRVVIVDDDTLAIRSAGLDIALKTFDDGAYGVESSDGGFEITSVGGRFYAEARVAQGVGRLSGDTESSRDRRRRLHVKSDAGQVSMLLRIAQDQTRPRTRQLDFDGEALKVKSEWDAFRATMPAVPEKYRPMAEVSWYNIWSCFVRADGHYAHDTILMSKKFMCSVWSWDHCFNALSISHASAQTALEQFLLPFELQAPTGALPDFWNPNAEINWVMTKPPIHGWCFDRLMSRHDFAPEQLRRVYAGLEKWTRWWMEFRDSDGDGIPEYPQGCDSGWDNATVFDFGNFVETPDLASFLILQMHTLARIAGKLGDAANAREWLRRAGELLSRLYQHSWNGERFVSRIARSHFTQEPQTSLLNLMPLVLGEMLDKDKFERLVCILERDFLTAHGLATEMPASPRYEPDGYWRGPIWAPSTYLIVDGLRRGGRIDLAREIARKFCDMIQETAGGNYENFDALKGTGLRAPGYTWTASVNLLLMHEYLG